MQKSRVQRIWENAVVFYLGGMFYCTVELLWRQWTHGSMFLLGGLCFWTVSSLGRRVRMPLLAQMALGAGMAESSIEEIQSRFMGLVQPASS